jgi:DNA-binding NarL/FixJ family response regulator
MREISVLRGYAGGLNTTKIAHNLCISVKTVEAHRQSLLLKVGAKTIGHAVAWAIKVGLVQFDVLTLEVVNNEENQEDV